MRTRMSGGVGGEELCEANPYPHPRTIYSPSPYLKPVREAQSVVATGSVAYSSITAVPHELFDQTGTAGACTKLP